MGWRSFLAGSLLLVSPFSSQAADTLPDGSTESVSEAAAPEKPSPALEGSLKQLRAKLTAFKERWQRAEDTSRRLKAEVTSLSASLKEAETTSTRLSQALTESLTRLDALELEIRRLETERFIWAGAGLLLGAAGGIVFE